MALVSTGFAMTVNLMDTGGQVSVLEYQLTSATVADAITDGAIIRTRLALITLSVIASYSIKENFAEDALALPIGAQNAVKAEMSVLLDTPGIKRAIFRVPSPVAGLFQSPTGSGQNIVNVGNADLQSYASIWLATGLATISDGEHILTPITSGLDKGRRISVNSRNP